MHKYLSKINWQKIEQNAIWAILILAASLRFTGLVKRDLWYDEAFTGVAVKEKFTDMISMIINDVHPPLYYVFLKWFSFFFNYSVFGLRLFSAVFGLGAVWGIYILTREFFDRRAALMASFLVAISPFAIQYSQEARMYSMLACLILLGAYFFVKGLKTKKTKYFIFWGILTGLSMLTHYMGIIFSVLFYPAYMAWKLFSESENSKVKNKREFVLQMFKKFLPDKNIFLGYLVAFLIFLPWIKKFIYHFNMKGNNLSWVKPASFGDIVVNMQMFLFGTPLGEMSSGMPQPNELHGIAQLSVRMVVAVLFGMALSYLFRKENKAKVWILLILSIGFMTLIYLLSIFTVDQQYFVARYLLPGALFLYVLWGVWLSKLNKYLISFILVGYIFLLNMIVPLTNSTGYNELIKNLDKYKNTHFYILNSFDYVISKYYIGDKNLYLYNYDWPQYNPSYWAAIGSSLKRTEDYEDLRNDPKAIIISNKVLNRDNQYFSTQGLVLVDQYKNILLYKFEK